MIDRVADAMIAWASRESDAASAWASCPDAAWILRAFELVETPRRLQLCAAAEGAKTLLPLLGHDNVAIESISAVERSDAPETLKSLIAQLETARLNPNPTTRFQHAMAQMFEGTAQHTAYKALSSLVHGAIVEDEPGALAAAMDETAEALGLLAFADAHTREAHPSPEVSASARARVLEDIADRIRSLSWWPGELERLVRASTV